MAAISIFSLGVKNACPHVNWWKANLGSPCVDKLEEQSEGSGLYVVESEEGETASERGCHLGKLVRV